MESWGYEISIHAPREGSDNRSLTRASLSELFQSTLPARGATQGPHQTGPSCQFQSTLPARGATTAVTLKDQLRSISIHAPREGSDVVGYGVPHLLGHFNPRSPRGERPAQGVPLHSILHHFNPRSPRGERLAPLRAALSAVSISIHAPREGSDLATSSATGWVSA